MLTENSGEKSSLEKTLGDSENPDSKTDSVEGEELADYEMVEDAEDGQTETAEAEAPAE